MYTINYVYEDQSWNTHASTLEEALAELARVRKFNTTAVLFDQDGYLIVPSDY